MKFDYEKHRNKKMTYKVATRGKIVKTAALTGFFKRERSDSSGGCAGGAAAVVVLRLSCPTKIYYGSLDIPL